MQDNYKHIKQYAKIGIALSAEKNINKLFEMIVEEARSLCFADAGTLYILDKKRSELRFEILQNDTMKTRLGGTSDLKIKSEPVPLFINDKPNYENVSSYVALTGRPVNIPDVYSASEFDFTGPKKYDEQSGYTSKSMLVIPMKNHEDHIIGVLQLLNAQDFQSKSIIPFSSDYEDLIAALASQAAVALNNVQLIQELELLFHSFIRSIATAIDEKSPYTGGHIKRVVKLTSLIAEKINFADAGPFEDVYFSKEEMEELRIAAWMHDVGKITTPEFVIDKMTKLETIFDRINLIETRFQLIRELTEKHFLKQKLDLLQTTPGTSSELKLSDRECAEALDLLDKEFQFIKSCNNTGDYMSDEMVHELNRIAKKTYSVNGEKTPYLTENEVENLCVRKGTLTDNERKSIENHASMTLKITNELPFPEHLANIPKYASAHHEKLDGSGYPLGLSAKDLPLQSRILCIADIFEALTARDRPYKDPMKLSQAMRILGYMGKDSHLDQDILDLFVQTDIHKEYAAIELGKDQVDM